MASPVSNIIGLLRLIGSVCGVAWNALKLAWTHHAFLLEFTEELRKTLDDKLLAIGGVSSSSEVLKVANANSIEVQRFLHHTRALVQSDLVPASVPTLTSAVAAATSEAPRIHALRGEIAQLMDAMPAAQTLDALTKAVHTTWAHHAAVNALIGDSAFVDATLSATAAGLDLAYSKKVAATTLVTALDGFLLKEGLAEKAMLLTAKGLDVAVDFDVRLTQTLDGMDTLLDTAPVAETFALAEKGATLFWENSPGLLNLLNTSGPALIEAGKAAVMTSYFLNGAAARSGMAAPTNLETPAALDATNLAQVVRDTKAGMTRLSGVLVDIAAGLKALPVKVPRAALVLDSSATLGWKVDVGEEHPFGEVAKKFHDVDDANNQNTATKKLAPAIQRLTDLQTQIEQESSRLFVNGEDLFKIGLAL